MKTIKELVAEVRQRLSDEVLSEVSSMLKEIERTADNIVDDLKSANAESKSRKLKIRELEKEIDTLKEQGSEMEELRKQLDELKKYKDEYENVQKKIFEDKKNEWQEKIKLLTVPEDDERYKTYQKLREQFVIPEKEEEITLDIINKNLEKFAVLEAAGVFSDKVKFPINPQGQGGGGGKIKDPLDID